MMNPKGLTPRNFQALSRNLFFGCLGFWTVWWVLLTTDRVRLEKNYYRWVFRSPLGSLRALHTIYDPEEYDFYRILRACDRILPLGEELQIILPERHVKFELFREKARYFLYPRNYGDNTIRKDYILVYQVNNFYRPEGYKTLVTFAPDKYLLTNRTF